MLKYIVHVLRSNMYVINKSIVNAIFYVWLFHLFVLNAFMFILSDGHRELTIRHSPEVSFVH